MTDHLFTVLCHHVSVDNASNNITLSGVFTSVRMQHPVPPEDDRARGTMAKFPFHLVTAWGRAERERGESSWRYARLFGPNREPLLSTEYRVDLTESTIHHQRIQFAVLPVTESGRYLFEVGIADVRNEGRDVAHQAPLHVAPLDVDITWVEDSAAEFEKVIPSVQMSDRLPG